MVSSKRPRDEGQPARRRHFHIPKAGLEALGGEWARQAPFEGHENALYEWISDPALWARVVLSDIDMPNDAESHSRTPSRVKMLSCAADEVALDANEAATVPNEGHVFHAERSASSSRSQHRLGQLHLGFREALDADGFVLWRLFPALGPSHLVLRQAGMPPNRLPLCRFTLKSKCLANATCLPVGPTICHTICNSSLGQTHILQYAACLRPFVGSSRSHVFP